MMTQYQFESFFEDILKDALLESLEKVEVPSFLAHSSWENVIKKLAADR